MLSIASFLPQTNVESLKSTKLHEKGPNFTLQLHIWNGLDLQCGHVMPRWSLHRLNRWQVFSITLLISLSKAIIIEHAYKCASTVFTSTKYHEPVSVAKKILNIFSLLEYCCYGLRRFLCTLFFSQKYAHVCNISKYCNCDIPSARSIDRLEKMCHFSSRLMP